MVYIYGPRRFDKNYRIVVRKDQFHQWPGWRRTDARNLKTVQKSLGMSYPLDSTMLKRLKRVRGECD